MALNVDEFNGFKVGEYVVYITGDGFELGRIKRLTPTGAFVAYHEGETGALTPYNVMHKIVNEYTIKETTLGGEYFNN